MSNYIHALDASGRSLEHREGTLASALRHLVLALRIRAERRHLAGLSDAALADIGVSRAEADREARRSLLDIPEHRKSMLYL